MTQFFKSLAVTSALLFGSSACAQTTDINALKSAFIQQQQTLGFSATETEAFLAKAKLNQDVLDAIARPWEAKPWYQYYPIFLTDKRLNAGLTFWRQHQRTLTRAAATYGVEPQIIVAIIGIETFYGHYMGKYPVLDALYTLGFHYPPRANFFRSELGQLQQLIKEEQLPLNQLTGSYAGAMGFGQFISSSYRHYAVDFDHDGKRDLLTNPVDAIGSVANYFSEHGWQAEAPIVLPLVNNDNPKAKVWNGKKLTATVADILSPDLSLKYNQDINANQKAMLIGLEQAKHTEYWLGLKNFYVITRYNRSPLYAMAVFQFSEQLKHAYEQD